MKSILQLISRTYSWRVQLLEKKIGYQVEFTHIPKAWINGVVRINMGPSWAKHGIRTLGVNYWTIGSLTENGTSSRYVRNKRQYQSWLGAYLVKFKDDRNFTLQDHFNLAVADQINWLVDFGDPNPHIEMPAENIKTPKPIKIGNYSGTLYNFFGGPSHSDVGSKSNNFRNRLLMRGAALLFNTSNPKLDINYKNLIPTDIHTEYETVVIQGYIAVIDLEKNTKVVLYGNGVALLDKNRNEIKDYTSVFREDILSAFRAVRIKKI